MKKVLAIISLLVVVLLVVVILFLGQIVKTGIETVGSKLTGVPIGVERVLVRPLTGKVHVTALVIGNPDGFNTPHCMELGKFYLQMDMASLFSDTILINKIQIDKPQINYERALKGSNLSTILDTLELGKPTEEESTEKKPGKKVIIQDFLLTEAKVSATFTAMGGKKITFTLPKIHMQNIGEKSDGTSLSKVLSKVLTKITKSVGSGATEALKSAGNIAGETLKEAGGAAKNVGEKAGEAVKDTGSALKKKISGLFGKD